MNCNERINTKNSAGTTTSAAWIDTDPVSTELLRRIELLKDLGLTEMTPPALAAHFADRTGDLLHRIIAKRCERGGDSAGNSQ